MNAQGSSPRRWPTAPGGSAGTAEQGAAAEAAVADLLTWPGPSGRPLDGGSLGWFYLPFTDLGRDEGLDLSWEVQVERGDGRSGPPAVEIGGSATLLEALQDLPSWPDRLPGRSAAPPRSAAARALQEQ